MMTRTFASVAVMAALGFLAPMHANAFGLGKLELSSALNEPFKAEIGITALKGDEANNLQVRLASSKEFEQAGIERSFLLTQLKFDVVEKSGNVKIVISSQQPIREPFIDFLLTATTNGTGRLIREYTVLLDPPKSIFNKPATQSVQIPAKTLAKTTTPTSVSPSTTYKTAPFDSSSYGPVVRTDTLWDVALKTRPERSVTVHQMMMALLKSNPNAFQHDNVNGLKAGYTLSIPSKNDIYKLTKQQAINAFAEQNVLWKNRNARPIVETVTADKIVTPKPEDMPAADKAAATETKEAISETTEQVNEVNDTARLKLVVPNDQSSLDDDALSPLGAEKVKVLSEQLTLAQETIEGQTQENIDFKARMDALEVQMETMRRLISLKDADLARLQSMLETDQAADENINNDSLEATQASDESNASQSESAKDISAIEDELESTFNAVQKFVANNKLEMAIVAGSLLLVLVGLLIAKRRREDDADGDDVWDETQNLVNNDDEDLLVAQPAYMAEDKLEQATNVAETEQIVDTDVVDNKTVAEMIEQADMLIAYADYDKAIPLLEQAQEQEPTNQLVVNKLLHVMFKQQRKESFVSLAGSLDIDKDSLEWSEISTWGRKLDPLNPLFNLASDNSEPETSLTLDSFSNVKDDDSLVVPVLEEQVDDIEEPLSNTIEFNLDDYAKEADVDTDTAIESLEEINDNDESLSFDTTFSLDNEDTKTDFDTSLNFEDDLKIHEDVLSVDEEPISLDLTKAAEQTELLPTDDSFQNLDTNLDLDADDSGFEFDIDAYDDIDEAETKLDLASAYADMGDPEGARNILEEVLKEGNDEQKSKAQALLKELS